MLLCYHFEGETLALDGEVCWYFEIGGYNSVAIRGICWTVRTFKNSSGIQGSPWFPHGSHGRIKLGTPLESLQTDQFEWSWMVWNFCSNLRFCFWKSIVNSKPLSGLWNDASLHLNWIAPGAAHYTIFRDQGNAPMPTRPCVCPTTCWWMARGQYGALRRSWGNFRIVDWRNCCLIK